jgi:protein-L-isoaspartate(D-aspartate) O-methyltransferase
MIRPGIGMTSQRTRLRMVDRLREAGIKDEAVLAVMAEVPRHVFVEEALATRAYDDVPLPIGFGQTISSPYIVARMCEVMRTVAAAGEPPAPGKDGVRKAEFLPLGTRIGKVLEIGTGCGYQTAVLSKLAREVYSVERIGALLEKARTNLRPLRLPNIRLKHSDGMLGLAEVAPFDAIIVAAAAPDVPRQLLEQLAVGGKLVVPVGVHDQYLLVIERTEEGFVENKLEAVRFVPVLPGTA